MLEKERLRERKRRDRRVIRVRIGVRGLAYMGADSFRILNGRLGSNDASNLRVDINSTISVRKLGRWV